MHFVPNFTSFQISIVTSTHISSKMSNYTFQKKNVWTFSKLIWLLIIMRIITWTKEGFQVWVCSSWSGRALVGRVQPGHPGLVPHLQENPGRNPDQNLLDWQWDLVGSQTSSWSWRGHLALGIQTSGGVQVHLQGFPPRYHLSRCPVERPPEWGWVSGEVRVSEHEGQHWSIVSSHKGTLV